MKFAAFAAVLAALLVSFARPAAAQDIVDVAAANPQFSTLVSLIKQAGLVDTLKSKGPFTVFAPTNDAFAKLPKSLVEKLTSPEGKAQLVKILTYHVVPGKVMAADVVKLANGTKVKTVQGSEIKVTTSPAVMVNNAKVVKTDVAASNGVIHVIDTVIVPGADKMPAGKMDKMIKH